MTTIDKILADINTLEQVLYIIKEDRNHIHSNSCNISFIKTRYSTTDHKGNEAEILYFLQDEVIFLEVDLNKKLLYFTTYSPNQKRIVECFKNIIDTSYKVVNRCTTCRHKLECTYTRARHNSQGYCNYITRTTP